jgi:hypothetical protein
MDVMDNVFIGSLLLPATQECQTPNFSCVPRCWVYKMLWCYLAFLPPFNRNQFSLNAQAFSSSTPTSGWCLLRCVTPVN